MKKFALFSAAVLAAVCLCSPARAAFSDVTEPSQSAAVSSLASLGIVNGFSDSTFRPDQSLTRAQFSKIAVSVLDFSEEELYSNYTIFPDAEGKMWATPYINAAARKYKILKGFPDGTFRPEQKITYEQAVTIILNMLGYQSSDIGTFWPSDYIAKAKLLGICDGISLSAGQYVTRGQAAVMFYNMLNADTKENGSFMLSTYKTVKSDAVLLDCGTARDGKTTDAKFYIASDTITLDADFVFDSSAVGKLGTVIMKDSNTARGFVLDDDRSVQGNVSQIKANSVSIGSDSYTIPSTANIYAGDKLSPYSSGWIRLKNGDSVSAFFDNNGNVSLLLKTNSAKSEQSQIFGVNIFASSVGSDKIVKNGVSVSVDDLKKYDVLSYDSANKTYYASDKKLKGIYQKATPSYSHPQSITVFGQDFTISEQCAGYFAKMNIGDSIVLLLDDNGTVCGAFADSVVACTNTGYFSSLSASAAQIELISADLSVSGTADLSVVGSGTTAGIPLVQLDVGKLVSVTQKKNGQLFISAVNGTSKKYGAWDIEKGTLGDYTVSPQVTVYEQVIDGAPLCRVSVEDIKQPRLSSSEIKNVLFDNSGSVIAIVTGDVTGLSWEYGIVSVADSSDSDSTTKSISLKQSGADYSTVTKTYLPRYSGGITAGKVGAIPKGMDSLPFIRNLTGKSLSAASTVGVDSFDGAQGVMCGDNYIEISENVQVYLSDSKKFISLAEALMNYSKFTIYLNRGINDNPMCVFITVK